MWRSDKFQNVYIYTFSGQEQILYQFIHWLIQVLAFCFILVLILINWDLFSQNFSKWCSVNWFIFVSNSVLFVLVSGSGRRRHLDASSGYPDSQVLHPDASFSIRILLVIPICVFAFLSENLCFSSNNLLCIISKPSSMPLGLISKRYLIDWSSFFRILIAI